MIHRGEIIEQAVRKSGYSISKLAEKMGKSRRWMYLLFENPDAPLDTIDRLGKIIRYDFTEEIKELLVYKASLQEDDNLYLTPHSVDYWKEKYYDLLEEYNMLLKKFIEVNKA